MDSKYILLQIWRHLWRVTFPSANIPIFLTLTSIYILVAQYIFSVTSRWATAFYFLQSVHIIKVNTEERNKKESREETHKGTREVKKMKVCNVSKGKGKVNLSLCFNWTPRHEGVLGEWRYSSTYRPPYPQRKSPWYPLERRLGGPEPVWTRWWREKFPAPT
jgi:hypothetical protein